MFRRTTQTGNLLYGKISPDSNELNLNLSIVKIFKSVGLRNVGVLEWVITICLLILSKPYFVWHSSVPTIATVISVLVALGCHEVPYGKKFYGFLCLCLFYLLAAIRHTSLGGTIVLCMIPLLLLISKKSFLNAFHNFVILLAFLLVPSLIMYVLVTFWGISIPSIEVQPINELKEYTYSQYPFLIFDNIERGLVVTRFHALFDEPGVIGSLAGLVLWVNGFNLKKWYNIVLFISGIFSFSLFFYLLTIIYIIIYSKTKTKASIILFLVISIPILLQNFAIFSRASAPALCKNFCRAFGFNEEMVEDILSCHKSEFALLNPITYEKDVKTEPLKKLLLASGKYELIKYFIKIKD